MKAIIFILLLATINTGCSQNSTGSYIYEQPENINDGLETGSLSEAGMDPALITKAIDRILEG